jgi:hypothetical protein
MKSYMKDRRREVDSWTCSDDFVVKPGERADILLEHMPRNFMMCEPIIIGKDEDGLVVEWCYNKVIFTLARVSRKDVVFGNISAYAVYKIYEITPKKETEDVQ